MRMVSEGEESHPFSPNRFFNWRFFGALSPSE